MTNKIIYLLLLIVTLGGVFFSCEEENFNNSDAAKLSFSTDTVMFDTIFTTLGSTTQSFRVINPGYAPVKISTIKLAGGENSPYRLNIDGEMVNEVKDYELRGNDSLYIFVEVTVDPNGVNQPMIVQDSIIFKVNGNLQDVDLIAFGQDFVLIKGDTLKTTTWTADKPYLVYDSVIVGEQQVLNIEPGARIHFHNNAYCRVFGAIKAVGTPEKKIIFQGDRLEHMYYDVPNQWIGMFIVPSPMKSVFENVEILNGMVGLDMGNIYGAGSAEVKLHNVKIEHMGFYGIRSINSKIEATNTLVADCGQYCLYLLVGGSYSFTHCTIANYWTISSRKTPAVVISNYGKLDSIIYTSELIKADWRNSVIWGSLASELILADIGQNTFNFNFEKCAVKVNDQIYSQYTSHFQDVLTKIEDSDTLFYDADNYNFMPDSLSPIRNIGKKQYGDQIPLDLGNNLRNIDLAPDIGAYEYIYIEKKEDEK